MGDLQPRWLLVALVGALVFGIAVAVWLYQLVAGA
jgi:nitrate reductase NapE component